MPSQDIEPSHQAAVDLLEIRKPTNCVTLMARTTVTNGVWGNAIELQDQNCDITTPWIICTISYGIGLGASIGKDISNRFFKERGMAPTPKMEYQAFLCIFQKNSAMAKYIP